MVDDGMATSAPVVINFAINSPTNQPPAISITSSAGPGWAVSPTNLVLTANVSAINGVQQVNFFRWHEPARVRREVGPTFSPGRIRRPAITR